MEHTQGLYLNQNLIFTDGVTHALYILKIICLAKEKNVRREVSTTTKLPSPKKGQGLLEEKEKRKKGLTYKI